MSHLFVFEVEFWGWGEGWDWAQCLGELFVVIVVCGLVVLLLL